MALVSHSESMTPAQVMAKDMTHASLVTASKALFTTLTAIKVGLSEGHREGKSHTQKPTESCGVGSVAGPLQYQGRDWLIKDGGKYVWAVGIGGFFFMGTTSCRHNQRASSIFVSIVRMIYTIWWKPSIPTSERYFRGKILQRVACTIISDATSDLFEGNAVRSSDVPM